MLSSGGGPLWPNLLNGLYDREEPAVLVTNEPVEVQDYKEIYRPF